MSWGPKVFDDYEYVLDALLKIQMSPAQVTVIWGPEDNRAGKVTVEFTLHEDGISGKALDLLTGRTI
jgi:hypothetical protein